MSDSEAETWALSSASSSTGGCRGRHFVKIPKGLKKLLNELTTEVRTQIIIPRLGKILWLSNSDIINGSNCIPSK